ncbi:MAG: response regulator [Pseudomonadales bacterium]|nr:response regulator [Pseudomonadales bacterium]
MSDSQFMENFNHELRTSMNGLLGMLTLAQDTVLDEEQRTLIGAAYSSGEAQLALLDDLQDVSDIDSGNMVLAQIGFDVHILVEDVVERIAHSSPNHKVEIASLIEAKVPQRVRGDPAKLRQVLKILVSSALKCTVQGEVIVRVSYPKENVLCFEIDDTGAGLSAEDQEGIFRPFLHGTKRGAGVDGTGLRLSLCRKIVNLMGGEIGVESESDEGAKFWFTVGVEKISGAKAIFLPSEDLAGRHILVVCSNLTRTQVLRGYFESWQLSYTLIDDINAPSTVDLSSLQFDLVIVDVSCTDEALKVADHVKSLVNAQPLRFVALCARVLKDDRRLLQNAGFNGFLSAPVRASKLRDCMLLVGDRTISETFVTSYTVDEARYNGERHVLIVEDNPLNQKVAQGLLRKMGCRVEVACNGQEAVDVLADRVFDLVFMDCQMPVLDGLKAVQLIRAREKQTGQAYQPIVAMTTASRLKNRDASLVAGMDDQITIPVTHNVLKSMLDIWGIRPQI